MKLLDQKLQTSLALASAASRALQYSKSTLCVEWLKKMWCRNTKCRLKKKNKIMSGVILIIGWLYIINCLITEEFMPLLYSKVQYITYSANN